MKVHRQLSKSTKLSQELQQKIKIANRQWGKAKESVLNVYKQALSDGWTPVEAAKICRDKLVIFSPSTIRGILPDESKTQSMKRSGAYKQIAPNSAQISGVTTEEKQDISNLAMEMLRGANNEEEEIPLPKRSRFDEMEEEEEREKEREREKPIKQLSPITDEERRALEAYKNRYKKNPSYAPTKEEVELLSKEQKIEQERRNQIINKINWDKLPNVIIYFNSWSFTEEESKIILREALDRLNRSRIDLENKKKDFGYFVDKQNEMMQRFKICMSCNKYKGTRHPGEGSYLTCKRCYKRDARLNRELSPIINQMLGQVLSESKSKGTKKEGLDS